MWSTGQGKGNLRSFVCALPLPSWSCYTIRIAETSHPAASSGPYKSTPIKSTPTISGYLTPPYRRHACYTRRPRAHPLLRSALNQDPRIHPDIRTIMLFSHMRLAIPISHIGLPKAQREACQPFHEAREHAADPRNESAQLGQEAVWWLQEREEKGRQIRVHHLLEEPQAQAEVCGEVLRFAIADLWLTCTCDTGKDRVHLLCKGIFKEQAALAQALREDHGNIYEQGYMPWLYDSEARHFKHWGLLLSLGSAWAATLYRCTNKLTLASTSGPFGLIYSG